MRHKIPSLAVAFGIMFSAIGYLIVELESTQHQAAKSRVTTVEQRCELSELTLEEARLNHSPLVPRFEKSLRGCESSLIHVKHAAR